MGWLRDASRGLLQDQEAARAPQARCGRVKCGASVAAVPTASAVAEGVNGSTPDAHLGRAIYAVRTCVRAVRKVSGR